MYLSDRMRRGRCKHRQETLKAIARLTFTVSSRRPPPPIPLYYANGNLRMILLIEEIFKGVIQGVIICLCLNDTIILLDKDLYI